MAIIFKALLCMSQKLHVYSIWNPLFLNKKKDHFETLRKISENTTNRQPTFIVDNAVLRYSFQTSKYDPTETISKQNSTTSKQAKLLLFAITQTNNAYNSANPKIPCAYAELLSRYSRLSFPWTWCLVVNRQSEDSISWWTWRWRQQTSWVTPASFPFLFLETRKATNSGNMGEMCGDVCGGSASSTFESLENLQRWENVVQYWW